jgi:hypothetical protein
MYWNDLKLLKEKQESSHQMIHVWAKICGFYGDEVWSHGPLSTDAM